MVDDDNNDDADPGGADGAILLVADVAVVNVDPFKEVLVVVVGVVATTCDLTLTAGGALLLVVGAADIDAIWYMDEMKRNEYWFVPALWFLSLHFNII